jgi:hypothetical protein
VTIKFEGAIFGREAISYYLDANLEGDELTLIDYVEEVELDVKKYRIFSEGYRESYSEDYDPDKIWTIVDSLPEDYDDYYEYEAGNYATLSKPGYYMVVVSPPL